MKNATLREKPYAGNPHVRFDEGEVASGEPGGRGAARALGLVLVCTAAFGGFAKERISPFDDVSYYFHGGSDLNGDGVYASGAKEFTDLTHVGIPDSPYHAWSLAMTGAATTRTGAEALPGQMRALKDVILPYAGRVVTDSPFLRLEQPFYTNSFVTVDDKEYPVGQLYANYATLPYAFQDVAARGETVITNYTVLLRYRHDKALVSDVQAEYNLFQLGFSWWGNSGVAIGFNATGTANVEIPRVYFGQSVECFWNLQATRGRWTELAIRVEGTKVTLYQDSNASETELKASMLNSQGATFSSTAINLNSATRIIFGGEEAGLTSPYTNGVNGTHYTTGVSNKAKAFRGDLNMCAFWARALSEEEIRQAFSERRPTIVRMGFANGSSDEFTKADTQADANGLHPETWNPVLNAAHPTASVAFTIGAGEEDVSQYLRVRPVAGSAAARIAVALDGKSVTTADFSPTEDTLVYFKAALMTKGAHTLTFTRLDANEGDFTIDAFSLSGSWRVGTGIGDHGGMSHETDYPYQYTDPRTFRLSDGNLVHFARGFTGGATGENATHSIQFFLPEDLIGQMRDADLAIRFGSCAESQATTYDLTLNGTTFKTATVKPGATLETKVSASLLKAGENTLSVHKTAGAHWANCPMYRLSLGRPPVGGWVILK